MLCFSENVWSINLKRNPSRPMQAIMQSRPALSLQYIGGAWCVLYVQRPFWIPAQHNPFIGFHQPTPFAILYTGKAGPSDNKALIEQRSGRFRDKREVKRGPLDPGQPARLSWALMLLGRGDGRVMSLLETRSSNELIRLENANAQNARTLAASLTHVIKLRQVWEGKKCKGINKEKMTTRTNTKNHRFPSSEGNDRRSPGSVSGILWSKTVFRNIWSSQLCPLGILLHRELSTLN